MPHVDELLGVATIAAAGMFAAISLTPLPSGAPGAAGAHAGTRLPSVSVSVMRTAETDRDARAGPAAAPIAEIPTIEVVARQSVELARIEREERLAREERAKPAARPKA